MEPRTHHVAGPTDVLAQVADVVCPCSAGLGRPFSVTEMDVIREVSESDTEIGVVLELTDPTCPFGLAIADAIEGRLAAVAGGRKVSITFTFGDDLWSEERMGKAAAERLRRIREDERAGT
jgi:metal-sulfur cluster biosynthetic enzyme